MSYNYNGEAYMPSSMGWFVAALGAALGLLCGHVEGCSMATYADAPRMDAERDARIGENHANLLRVEFSDAICYCSGPAESGGCYVGAGTLSCFPKPKP